MSEPRTSKETAQRQRLLEDELYNAMLQMPYADISVSDLCQRTGVSRKSFYRYFGSKDGCLSALLDRVLLGSSVFQETFHHAPGGMIPDLLQVMEYWVTQKPLLDVVNANALQPKLLDRCLHYATNKGQDSLRRLGIELHSTEPETAIFAITGFISLLLTWSREGFPKSPAQMAHIMDRVLTHPLVQINRKL